MTKTEISSMFKAALTSVGYGETRIRRHYDFCDLTGPVAKVRRIPLAAFSGYPQSYRNARIGVIFVDEFREDLVNEYRALGAPLLLAVAGDKVKPWAVGTHSVKPAGKDFPLRDTQRIFSENQSSWGPDSLGRVKHTTEFSSNSQIDIFDSGLVPSLERQFQARLKELLEHSFQEISQAYKLAHGRPPKVSPLFAFLFRFVTAKIFMDRADADGWDGLHSPLEILKAAEKQTGLLDKPESDFRHKNIIEVAWRSVKTTLHFQNLSVPDLAFVAESAFITDSTRDELGVHSTPAGLAEYVVNQLPWDEVPVAERVVFEPFCGHGIFLAKALERMGLDLAPSLGPKGRHEYFRKRLIGVEADPLSLEICRLVLTLSDYPNGNSWEHLYCSDVFEWADWQNSLKAAKVVLANPPYEAFDKKYREHIKAKKTKPPAEFLQRLLLNPPQLLGLVLPQSFLSDPVYRDANRSMARKYGLIKIVELPPVFRYADNETVAIMASGLRVSGETVQVHYAEVHKNSVESFLSDWHVSEARNAKLPVPPLAGRVSFSLRLLPENSVFPQLRSHLKLGDIAEIHKGINWVARTDGKSQSSLRTDVASDRKRDGFTLGAEKMNGNLSQFQLRHLRYLSLLDKDQDPSTRANIRPWNKRKVVCNAARKQIGSPWRFVAWADKDGIAFTKQFFAIWPSEGISEFAIAAILASPVANAFSFERDLDRDNHIETLLQLPLPDLRHLTPEGKIHQMAMNLQNILTLRDFSQPPSVEEVKGLVLRLDAEVLKAYNLSGSSQKQLLKIFNGWSRPLPSPYENEFASYFPDSFDEDITLSDLISITLDWDLTSERKTHLIDRKIKRIATKEELFELEQLKFLTEARGELFAPLPLKKLADLRRNLESQGKWKIDQ